MTGLPKSIQIQTTTKCTRRCSWCPNHKLEEGEMSFTTLDAILDNLGRVGYQGRLHPYLMAEPLCDKRILDIVWEIRKRFPKNMIYLYSNGDLLDKRMCRNLRQAGLDGITVSLYDSSEELAELRAKYPWFIHVIEGIEEPYNRAGHVEVECPKPGVVCEWLWKKAYINWKGEMILCCSDYGFEVVMGDLKKQEFENIWYSELYEEYRYYHRHGEGWKLPLCNRCNRIGGQEDGKV